MEQFTEVDLKNIAELIKVAPINGNQALTVAQLLLKIDALMKPKEEIINDNKEL